MYFVYNSINKLCYIKCYAIDQNYYKMKLGGVKIDIDHVNKIPILSSVVNQWVKLGLDTTYLKFILIEEGNNSTFVLLLP